MKHFVTARGILVETKKLCKLAYFYYNKIYGFCKLLFMSEL